MGGLNQSYHARVKDAVSLRTFQRNLAKINQKALKEGVSETDPDDGTEGGDTENAEGDGEEETGESQDEREEIQTGPELLTKHATEMLEVLKGRSIRNDAMRIKRAAELVKDLQRAVEEGTLFPPVHPDADEANRERLEPPQPSTLEPSVTLDADSSEIIRLAVAVSGIITTTLAPVLIKTTKDAGHAGATVVENATRILELWHTLNPENKPSTGTTTKAGPKAAQVRRTKPKTTAARRPKTAIRKEKKPAVAISPATASAANVDSDPATVHKTTSAPSETQEASTRSAPKKPVGTALVAKSGKPQMLDGVTVAPGFRCKFNGKDCQIENVFPKDESVTLIHLGDSTPVGAGPIHVRELRFIKKA
jgi:hypothetical protein